MKSPFARVDIAQRTRQGARFRGVARWSRVRVVQFVGSEGMSVTRPRVTAVQAVERS